MRSPVRFPEIVNEKAARVVASGVAALAIAHLATGWWPLVPLLAAGFLARVVAGPRFSPLALVSTRVVAPRLGPPVLVPGPPKRFAQGIGLCVTAGATVALLLGAAPVARGAIAVLLVFALFEATVGFCAGCWAFGQLVRLGALPPSVCAACADLRPRRDAVGS